jgi:hypothetical protein
LIVSVPESFVFLHSDAVAMAHRFKGEFKFHPTISQSSHAINPKIISSAIDPPLGTGVVQ